MAIKKSELYSSLWASCDELRGGMDASQYKDYVLVMLFIKYISDKYANEDFAPIVIPQGATFQDMVALKGDPEIGDKINKYIISPIKEANGLAEMPDFNSPEKLGSGKDMVNKLSNLIAIFENPALDFKKNRAGGDDILGDAYEYLMRHFATESGKSKGQFYTPAEVSRVVAKVIGIHKNMPPDTSVYDPTCGSGSLLLKVADEVEIAISLFGQEMDVATASLARMNMILHNSPTAVIRQGNTLSNPLFKDEQGRLKTFDFIVANPPFSFKSWSNGVNIGEEVQDGGRFYGYGVPPSKNGDYAFMLHILKSLKSNGKAAVILPHGVLFRGNAESEIRQAIIKKGFIKGIIGLPANLFYGTGIPACLIVIDKENATNRKGIFMMDASKGFIKDGNKNRLREQDIHKIVDVFNKELEIPKYSRMVSLEEIEAKEFNLNIPRYIDSTEPEDIQNIEAHLLGGIPNSDIDALQEYWKVYPSLKSHLFEPNARPNFSNLKIPKEEVKQSIFSHPEFLAYSEKVDKVFDEWEVRNTYASRQINSHTRPKEFIHVASEDLLKTFGKLLLIDNYDIYERLMNYWAETMQDDCYLLVADGWKVGNEIEWKKKEFEGKIIPKQLLIEQYFKEDQQLIESLEVELDRITGEIEEIEEEHNVEDGYFDELEKVNKNTVSPLLKATLQELKTDKNNEELLQKKQVLEKYLLLTEQKAQAKKKVEVAQTALNDKLLAKYPTLTEEEIKTLVVEEKWMATMESRIKSELQSISQRLAQRIKELAERYETPMPALMEEVSQWEQKVNAHLEKMGYVWNK